MIEKLASAMGKIMMVMIILVLGGAPIALLTALPVMLALGVMHNDWNTAVPALGYWATVITLWGLGVALAYLLPNSHRPKS